MKGLNATGARLAWLHAERIIDNGLLKSMVFWVKTAAVQTEFEPQARDDVCE
jgi:hypothetical protein